TGLPKPDGFGGWLVLPLLGAFVYPGVQLYTSWELVTAWTPHAWHAATVPGSATYAPLMAPFVLWSIVATAGLVALSVVLLVLFLRKRTSAPRVYIGLLLAVLCV